MCGCGRTSTERGMPARKFDRAHVVEEDERPHHAPLCGGQDAADLESAEIAASLLDDEIDHGHRRNLRMQIVRGFNGRCNVPQPRHGGQRRSRRNRLSAVATIASSFERGAQPSSREAFS